MKYPEDSERALSDVWKEHLDSCGAKVVKNIEAGIEAGKKKAKSNSLYDMELHEEIGVDIYSVLRVPGGWIYTHDGHGASVFIPKDLEFSPSKSKA